MQGRRLISVSAMGCLLAAGALCNPATAAGETGSSLSWSLAQPAQSPHPSFSSSTAFDAATGQLVLFGTSPDGGSCPPPLTWTWDGAGWASHTQANIPAGREFPTLAYDPRSKQVVMFGGTGYSAGCATIDVQQLTDTWTWNTAKLRNQEPANRHTPVIAITATATTEDQDRCLAAGMDDYLPKPIIMERLAEILHQSLNARYRRAVRARGHFPTEQAALKCLYLVTRSLDPTGRGRARWITRWKPALNAFAITFEGRLFPSNTAL